MPETATTEPRVISVIPHEPSAELLSFRYASDWIPEYISIRPMRWSTWDSVIHGIPANFIRDIGADHISESADGYGFINTFAFRFIYPGQELGDCVGCSKPIFYPRLYAANEHFITESMLGIHTDETYSYTTRMQYEGQMVFFEQGPTNIQPLAFLYAVRGVLNTDGWPNVTRKYENWHIACLRNEYNPAICSDCNVITDRVSMTAINNEYTTITVCVSCEGSRNYYRCNSCDEFFDDALYNFNHNMCDECSENVEDEDDYEDDYDNSVIHSYSYKPNPKFQYIGDDEEKKLFPNLYFGAEIEVEMRRDYEYETQQTALEIRSKINLGGESNEQYCYMKHDGSLSNGFEIVTHPGTFSWWTSGQNPVLWGLSEHSEKIRSYHSQNCGMHIHMSKDQFSNYHLMRFLWFIHNNQEFVEFIAQRRSNSYARFSSEEKNNLINIAKAKYSREGRFVAVNLENSYTVELRIFKGNIKPKRILKNIEFCHALYTYTFIDTENKTILDLDLAEQNHEILADITKDLSVPQFRDWVKKNSATYPNLSEFISIWRD